MEHPLSDMMTNTMSKIKDMIDVNTVVGSPITTPGGVTIIPVSKVSVGFGGGGSDFTKKTAAGDNPFGGGVGGGVKVTTFAAAISQRKICPRTAIIPSAAEQARESRSRRSHFL